MTISPLRPPELPGQTEMFDMPALPTTVDPPGAGVTFTVKLHRTPRQKCARCQQRRVCFYLGMEGTVVSSPPRCAACTGVR